jgi:hypothetical protein
MPGCVGRGHTRDEALANVREAMEDWLETEWERGGGPLLETPELISTGVAKALQLIETMRKAGDALGDGGYDLELATVDVSEAASI